MLHVSLEEEMVEVDQVLALGCLKKLIEPSPHWAGRGGDVFQNTDGLPCACRTFQFDLKPSKVVQRRLDAQSGTGVNPWEGLLPVKKAVLDYQTTDGGIWRFRCELEAVGAQPVVESKSYEYTANDLVLSATNDLAEDSITDCP